GERAIHYRGHVKMMGAIQPFISGAISKTVNLPETATIDEVATLYQEAWQLGVKAIAIYRDNCKVAQPLSGKGDKSAQATLAPGEVDRRLHRPVVRDAVPRRRPAGRGRDPLDGSPRADGGAARERRVRACRAADAGTDGALQSARGRDRVQPLRRPHGARRHL